MELQGRLDALKQQGISIAAISYDPEPVLADFSARRGIRFPLLSDPGSPTIKRYGIFNTTVPESNTQAYGVPFPGTFMLDTRGIVTARFFEAAYQERNTVSSILTRLGTTIDIPATRVSSPQVEITSFATDSTVAPGTHFSIVVEVRPNQGMHVYAPGAIGYRGTNLTIEAHPWIDLKAARYPPSEDYHFKPLDEHVQVYQRPFRVALDVVVDASPDAQNALKDVSTLTLHGVFSYQACDDKVCFAPQAVPLQWTIAVRQLDRERVKR